MPPLSANIKLKVCLVQQTVAFSWSYETFQITKGHNSGTIHIIVTIKLNHCVKIAKCFAKGN